MEHIYIHIPFCSKICSYCDFCKMFYNDEFVSKYLNALEEEFDDFYQGEGISTIYVGGGTPSSLKGEYLDKFFSIIKKINLNGDYEFTFECNPGDLNEDLIKYLVSNGVNRLSIGVESFDKNNLEILERDSDFIDIQSKINMCRSLGINNINIDLMYAIPGETIDTLKKDLKLFLKLKPDHISTYSLIIEDHTKLKINDAQYIDEELDREMYDYIVSKLGRKGFNHYELSNFALPHKESIHNLAYWCNKEYYGFGLGAAGYMNGFRYENTRNLNDYLDGRYRFSEKLLSNQEVMEYEVMLGLRKMKGINLQEFYDRFEVNIQDYFPVKPLVKSGELIYRNGQLYINPDYIYVMNEILLKLI